MRKLTIEQIEEAHQYMVNHWVKGDEGWSDFAIADQAGDSELLAHMICQSGAIDSTQCYDWAKQYEQVVEQLAKDFRKLSRKQQDKRYHEAFKDVFIASCNDCNCVSFVHSGNEQLYPELKTECWECGSKNIEVRIGLKKRNIA